MMRIEHIARRGTDRRYRFGPASAQVRAVHGVPLTRTLARLLSMKLRFGRRVEMPTLSKAA